MEIFGGRYRIIIFNNDNGNVLGDTRNHIYMY